MILVGIFEKILQDDKRLLLLVRLPSVLGNAFLWLYICFWQSRRPLCSVNLLFVIVLPSLIYPREFLDFSSLIHIPKYEVHTIHVIEIVR